jgi:ornithine cyclodeaminase
MSRVVGLEEIRGLLPGVDLLKIIEEGFVAYSQGQVVVPPVGELVFDDPPGEAHIKYGYVKGHPYYVIKVASGFYDNAKLGLPTGQGLMLVFSQQTGVLEAVLLDEGYLTDMRTAAAGAVAARHLAPLEVRRIGILGAGVQARLQLDLLRGVVSCRRALVWAPEPEEREPYLKAFALSDFEVEMAEKASDVARECNLIVTATPATTPLLRAGEIKPGTHITAIGSDTAEKIELDPEILGKADLVVVDSLPQSESRGEVFRAVEAGTLARERVKELGAVIAGRNPARENPQSLTVCDLTGVAVQDIQIATAILREKYKKESRRRP